MSKALSRGVSLLIVAAAYIAALAAALAAYHQLKGVHPLVAAFLADVAATLVVWLVGVALGNSSVYDPYWSVAPLALAAFWAAGGGPLSAADIFVLAALLLWGARLTANWAHRWRGLGHQDWRYTMYRTRMPRLWFLINLLGINLMPTVLVYLAMIPAQRAMASAAPFNALTGAGCLLALAAVLLELAADRQMDTYKRRAGPKEPCIAEGLWLISRHPNYLGEILFWWGLWVMQISLDAALWTIAGPMLITALFVFVSIPMMERHILEGKPEYKRVIAEVPMLLPNTRRRSGAAGRTGRAGKPV